LEDLFLGLGCPETPRSDGDISANFI